MVSLVLVYCFEDIVDNAHVLHNCISVKALYVYQRHASFVIITLMHMLKFSK